MADEGKLRVQHDRGERAKRLLENELIVEAFEKIEAEITESWRNSAVDEAEKRHNAYLMGLLLERFKQHFRVIVAGGEKAQIDLLQLEAKE